MVTPAAKPSTRGARTRCRCVVLAIRSGAWISQRIARGLDFGAQWPPRERPRPWASAPLFAGERGRRADALARWSSRSSAIRDRPRAPTRRGSRPERPSRPSGSSAASPPRAYPTTWADRASDSLSAPSTKGRSETDDCWCGDRACTRARQAKPSSRSYWSFLSASQSTANLQKSGLNLICAHLGIPVPLNRHYLGSKQTRRGCPTRGGLIPCRRRLGGSRHLGENRLSRRTRRNERR
jgi:hypothetical protein